MTDIDREMARIAPQLRRIENAIKNSGLPPSATAALMTMAASRLMGTAGAMMAAVADAKACRASASTPTDVADWVEATAKEVARIYRAGTVN